MTAATLEVLQRPAVPVQDGTAPALGAPAATEAAAPVSAGAADSAQSLLALDVWPASGARSLHAEPPATTAVAPAETVTRLVDYVLDSLS